MAIEPIKKIEGINKYEPNPQRTRERQEEQRKKYLKRLKELKANLEKEKEEEGKGTILDRRA